MTPRTRTFGWILVALMVAALVVTQLTATLVGADTTNTIRESQVTNTRTLDATEETLRLIESCTTPGEKCYEDGQKRTAAAVGDINRVIVLAAACSVGLDASYTVIERQDLITTCVIGRLSAKP